MGAREAGSARGLLHHLKRPAAAATWGAGLEAGPGAGPGAVRGPIPPGAPRCFVPRGWCPGLRCTLCVSACLDGPGHGPYHEPKVLGWRARRRGGFSTVYAGPGRLGVPCSPGS